MKYAFAEREEFHTGYKVQEWMEQISHQRSTCALTNNDIYSFGEYFDIVKMILALSVERGKHQGSYLDSLGFCTRHFRPRRRVAESQGWRSLIYSNTPKESNLVPVAIKQDIVLSDYLGLYTLAVEQKFRRYLEYREGWDGYSGKQIHPKAIASAKVFLQEMDEDFPAPHIAPNADGLVNFSWEKGVFYLDLYFHSDGKKSFYADEVDLGEIEFDQAGNAVMDCLNNKFFPRNAESVLKLYLNRARFYY